MNEPIFEAQGLKHGLHQEFTPRLINYLKTWMIEVIDLIIDKKHLIKENGVGGSSFTFPLKFSELISLIDSPGKILDIGSSNGLSLKFIVINSEYKLEPFGIDFDATKIRNAKEIIFPKFKGNFKKFLYRNGEDLPFNAKFKYIMLAALFFNEKNYNKLWQSLEKGGKLIFYTYQDQDTSKKEINLRKMNFKRKCCYGGAYLYFKTK